MSETLPGYLHCAQTTRYRLHEDSRLTYLLHGAESFL